MNRITKLIIILFFTSFILNGQTYSTGTVTLSNTSGLEITVKIDITATDVTLTLKGPADRWFGIGFGGNDMSMVTDAFIYDSSDNFDKRIVPYSTPQTDSNQDWTIISNVVNSSKREIVATRNLNTNENYDYVFTYNTNSIPVIWARGNGATISLTYHGSSNRGSTVLNPAVLNVNSQQIIRFSMYPNPIKDKLNIVLQSNVKKMRYKIYSVLGFKIKQGELNKVFNKIDISNLKKGVYLLKIIDSNNSFIIKKIIKE
jgi:hypothetical protein